MQHGLDWVGDAVWWHVYPLGFLGAERDAIADGRVEHRLGRLEPWLDYAVELGASGAHPCGSSRTVAAGDDGAPTVADPASTSPAPEAASSTAPSPTFSGVLAG